MVWHFSGFLEVKGKIWPKTTNLSLHSWPPSPLLKRLWPSKSRVTWGWGWGVLKFLLAGGITLKRGGWCRNGSLVVNFLLLYSSIKFTVFVGKVVSFITFSFFLQSFELNMQDSYPRLYSTNTQYHLYISDPFK